ncbi:MAG TPA: PDZ domain-containing protein, partial [Clostridia bacterium]
MKDKNVHRIAGVEPGSIADQLGITIGDVLLQTNGVQVLDVFDYRTAMMAENIAITVRTAEGLRAFDIEKDEDEDIGLVFDRPLMDDCRSCTNRCVFCFIDQLPEGMRKSLYFKDDDLRMSFLTGNYVTLTNLSDRELDRLIGYRLSPMNISIHALSPAVRHAMMGNRF